jgi:hypothetical protein
MDEQRLAAMQCSNGHTSTYLYGFRAAAFRRRSRRRRGRERGIEKEIGKERERERERKSGREKGRQSGQFFVYAFVCYIFV